jgi:hypothetical protein
MIVMRTFIRIADGFFLGIIISGIIVICRALFGSQAELMAGTLAAGAVFAMGVIHGAFSKSHCGWVEAVTAGVVAAGFMAFTVSFIGINPLLHAIIYFQLIVVLVIVPVLLRIGCWVGSSFKK